MGSRVQRRESSQAYFGIDGSTDGLIDPAAIPVDTLKPESVRTAADDLVTTAGSIRGGADGVTASWSGLSAVYESPEAGTLYAGMAPVGADGAAMAEKFESAATAVRAYADAMDAPKLALDALRTEARQFVTPILLAGGYVWIPWSGSGAANMGFANIGSGATTFAGPAQVRTPLQMAQDAGYQARSGASGVEVLVPWRESAPHVEQNNDLVARVNTEVAKVLEAEAACANAINGLRDSVCLAPVVAPTARELASVDVWGAAVEEDRNCHEGFTHGISTSAVEFVQTLGGYNPETGGWADLNVWGSTLTGMATAIGSLVIMVTPISWVLHATDREAYESARSTVIEMGKGLVAWDTWAKNPGEAAGRLVFNAATFVGPSAVGVAKATAGVGRMTAAVTGSERLAAASAAVGRGAEWMDRLPTRLGQSVPIAWDAVKHEARAANSGVALLGEQFWRGVDSLHVGPRVQPSYAVAGPGRLPAGGWSDVVDELQVQRAETKQSYRDVWFGPDSQGSASSGGGLGTIDESTPSGIRDGRGLTYGEAVDARAHAQAEETAARAGTALPNAPGGGHVVEHAPGELSRADRVRISSELPQELRNDPRYDPLHPHYDSLPHDASGNIGVVNPDVPSESGLTNSGRLIDPDVIPEPLRPFIESEPPVLIVRDGVLYFAEHVEVVFNRNKEGHSLEEFVRQVGLQEQAIQQLSAAKWQENLAALDTRNGARLNTQADYKTDWIADRAAVLQAQNDGMTSTQAHAAATLELKGQVGLHGPDQFPGGDPKQLTGFGHSGVNSSIGAQWGNGRGRDMRTALEYIIESSGIPHELLGDIRLDVKFKVHDATGGTPQVPVGQSVTHVRN